MLVAGCWLNKLQLNRRFQSAKLELQSDLDKSKRETFFEKTEKENFITRSDKATKKLREKYTGEFQDKYESELRRNRIIIFGVLPAVTIIITAFIMYSSNPNQQAPWLQYIIGIALNIAAWALTDFLYLDKKILSKYSERVNNISDEVEKKLKEDIDES